MQELQIPEEGRLADNILHFARALRAAGLPVGPSRAVEAVRAVMAAGVENKRDFYWTLQATLISRAAHKPVFDATFRLFWRDPEIAEKMMSMITRNIKTEEEEAPKKAGDRRAEEALLAGVDAPKTERPEQEEVEFDAAFTFSAEEKLRSQDFEQMSADEIAAAKRVIATLSLPVRPIASRRLRAAARGWRPDWRGTMRASLRTGGALMVPKHRTPQIRWPNLVALCDISGSMSAYSRMLLHFLHAAANQKGAGWSKVHSFVFGTRLTNITRQLALRDVDEALAAAGAIAEDWEGGTRIGACLHDFNRLWSRRVLGQGAVVLLITDGLDRDDPDVLAKEAERLRLSSRQLIWLNPLLRWEGFAPKARGVRALLPRVDSFRAAHNIESLALLAQTLGGADDGADKRRLMAMLAER